MGTACCCAAKEDGVEVTAYAVADGIQQGEYLEQTQKKYQWLETPQPFVQDVMNVIERPRTDPFIW